MRLGAALLGGLGVLLGLVAVWFAAGSGEVAPHRVYLSLGSCLIGLLGARLAAGRRSRLGALLLLDTLLGLGLGIGEYALIPGTLLLAAAALAWLAG